MWWLFETCDPSTCRKQNYHIGKPNMFWFWRIILHTSLRRVPTSTDRSASVIFTPLRWLKNRSFQSSRVNPQLALQTIAWKGLVRSLPQKERAPSRLSGDAFSQPQWRPCLQCYGRVIRSTTQFELCIFVHGNTPNTYANEVIAITFSMLFVLPWDMLFQQ